MKQNHLLFLFTGIFAVAMAFLESAVVVYLRGAPRGLAAAHRRIWFRKKP